MKIITKLLYITILSIIVSFILINNLSKTIYNYLNNYGIIEAKKIITKVINTSISKEYLDTLLIDNIISKKNIDENIYFI